MTKFWENRVAKQFFAAALIFTGAFISSCTDTNDRTGNDGFSLDDQAVFLTNVNDLKFETITQRVDSIDLENISIGTGSSSFFPRYYGFFGSLVTPEEGQINVGMATSLYPYIVPLENEQIADRSGYSSAQPFGSEVKVDSAFIFLRSRFSGAIGKQYTVYVYEFNKNVFKNLDTTWYSNTDINKYINPEPKYVYQAENGKTISIPIPEADAKRFLSGDISLYTDVDKFRESFPGYYFSTSKAFEGEVYNNVSIDSSGVFVYFHNKNAKPDTLTQIFSFQNTVFQYEPFSGTGTEIPIGKTFMTIERDFSLKDPTLGVKYDAVEPNAEANKIYCYASGMSGLNTKLTIPDAVIAKLKKEIEDKGGKKVVILNATFTLPIENSSPVALNNAMPTIGAYEVYATNNTIVDYGSPSLQVQFGGALNRATLNYQINVPTFIQNILNKTLTGEKLEESERSFYIAPAIGNKENTAVASFVNSDEKPITLSITYNVVK